LLAESGNYQHFDIMGEITIRYPQAAALLSASKIGP
jgi:hypothetical protein